MPTNAAIGYETFFEFKYNGDWIRAGEATGLTPPSVSVDSIDASHEESPNARREFIPGMVDEGETSFPLNFVPGSAGMIALRASLRKVLECREIFPNGVIWTFSAFITEISPDAPLDDKMTCDVTLKLTGESAIDQPQAPANVLTPSIAGIAQEGQTLTALPGSWSWAPTFTYQWKKAGVDIAGATGRTYVPVAGDVAAEITVAVKGTNNVGNATAVSPAVTPIAAA